MDTDITDIVGGIHANRQIWGSKQCPLKIGEVIFCIEPAGLCQNSFGRFFNILVGLLVIISKSFIKISSRTILRSPQKTMLDLCKDPVERGW